jgi:hypothetical protein
MSKGHGQVERAILDALNMQRGRKGRWSFGGTTEDLARYVADYKVCGDAIHDRYHPYNCPIKSRERQAIAEARVRGEDYRPPPVTRSELESVRRALRNLRKQGLVSEPQR